MHRLHVAFVDDDEYEVGVFKRLYVGEIAVSAIFAAKVEDAIAGLKRELNGATPDLFVLDLYFPSVDNAPSGFQDLQPDDLCKVMNPLVELETTVSAIRSNLPANIENGAALLRDAHSAVRRAEHLMKKWCEQLGQSPKGGIRLLQELNKDYPRVPKVFYSAKATLDDAKEALSAGALDIIRKPDESLAMAQASEIAKRFEGYSKWQPPAYIIDWLKKFGVKVGMTPAGPTLEVSAELKRPR